MLTFCGLFPSMKQRPTLSSVIDEPTDEWYRWQNVVVIRSFAWTRQSEKTEFWRLTTEGAPTAFRSHCRWSVACWTSDHRVSNHRYLEQVLMQPRLCGFNGLLLYLSYIARNPELTHGHGILMLTGLGFLHTNFKWKWNESCLVKRVLH